MAHYFYRNNELKITPDMTWSEFKNGSNEEQLRCLAEKKGVDLEDLPLFRQELQEELKRHYATELCYFNLYEQPNESSNAVQDQKCKGCGCVYSWVYKPGTRARDYKKETQEEEKEKKDRKIKKYEVAEPVKVKCKGWPKYLKGIVTKDNGDDTYTIDFENEKKKYVKEMDMIKLRPGRWSIRKTPTVITNKETFDELPYDFYLGERSQNYPFNVKEDTRRTYQGGIDEDKPKCPCKSSEGFKHLLPLIKEESMRTFYDEGHLVINSIPGSDEMTLEEIAEKPLDITKKMCKLFQGSFKNDQSIQRVRGSRDCTVQPPLTRMICAIRYLLKKSDPTKNYEECDKKDNRRERSICENCRCGKLSCMTSQFPCHSYLEDGTEICHGTATQCKGCKNVFALCSFSRSIHYLWKNCKNVTNADWKELLEQENMLCTRCFLKLKKENLHAFKKNYTDKRLQKGIENVKKKNRKMLWRRRLQQNAEMKEKVLKHQLEHNYYLKDRYMQIAEAKINNDKSEGIAVTKTADQIAFAYFKRQKENERMCSFSDYYRENIQAKEEEEKKAEEKRKTLFDAKVNYITDMPKLAADKDNYFLKNFKGDEDDTLAVRKFNIENHRKWFDDTEKLYAKCTIENRKRGARVLRKCLDNPLEMTKEDAEIIKSWYKAIEGNDIEFERRGDKLYYEVITKKRKRADNNKIAPKRTKTNEDKSPPPPDADDDVLSDEITDFFGSVQTFEPPPREEDDNVPSDVDEDEITASGVTNEDDILDEFPTDGSSSWDNLMQV